MNPKSFLPTVALLFSLPLSGQTLCDSVLTIHAGTRSIAPFEYAERQDFHTVVFAEPCSVAEIGEGAFRWCESLHTVVLPETLKDIGRGAFAYCEGLNSVNFPSSLRHIGPAAFTFCKSLESVVLPDGITELESYAFAECTSLHSATLPANNHLLGELIFSGCQALESITCLSPTPPPFDCNSTLFEANESFMYRRCHLTVLPTALPLYREAPSWSLFF